MLRFQELSDGNVLSEWVPSSTNQLQAAALALNTGSGIYYVRLIAKKLDYDDQPC